MADAFWMKVREVDWTDYKTASGDANGMPTVLKNLSSRKLPRATRASHQAWTCLCGGGELHSAIVPSIPLLIDIYKISKPEIQDGILEILDRAKKAVIEEDWKVGLRNNLTRAIKTMERLRPPKDEITAAKLLAFLYD